MATQARSLDTGQIHWNQILVICTPLIGYACLLYLREEKIRGASNHIERMFRKDLCVM